MILSTLTAITFEHHVILTKSWWHFLSPVWLSSSQWPPPRRLQVWVMRGAATTRRRPTASMEETVTSCMVLTSWPASKLVAQSTPRPLRHHCVVAPSSLLPLSCCLCLSGVRQRVAGHHLVFCFLGVPSPHTVHAPAAHLCSHSLCTVSKACYLQFLTIVIEENSIL